VPPRRFLLPQRQGERPAKDAVADDQLSALLVTGAAKDQEKGVSDEMVFTQGA